MEDLKSVAANLSEGVAFVIKIVAKDGKQALIERALIELAEPTMAEPGIKLYVPYIPMAPAS